MKKFLKSLMLFAAAAMALTSCENEVVNDGIETNDTYTLTFTAGVPESKTSVSIDGNVADFAWSEGDKASFVQYAVNANKVNKKNSKPATIDGDEATFTTEFEKVDGETEYHYAAYFPASDLVNNNDKTFDNVIIKLPAGQNYTEGTFDPAADLMMSKTITTATEHNDHGGYLEFARLVAVGKMTLTGVEDGEVISSVKFTINDAVLAGNVTLDFVHTTAEFATEGSNTITISGANVGKEIIFTCFPGEYTGAYTIEVETDKANYKKVGTFAKAFKLTAGNVLTFTASAGTRTEKVVEAGETIDVLNRTLTGATSTSYISWTGKTSNSNAVYAGNSAGGNESIQLRSNNNNSGIVTTTSGGYAKKVVVTWNSNTANGRTLNIYGKNTAYTAATDLYGDNAGELLGTIVCGTSTELVIDGNYEYIGMRSAGSAMYLTKVEITWSSEAGGNTPVEPEPEPEPEPEDPDGIQTITIAQFIEKADTATTYQLTGTITGTYNTYYGNFYLEDASGRLQIYGINDANGNKCYTDLGLADGDIITLQGVYGTYNSTPQISGATYISHTVTANVTVDPETLMFSAAGGDKTITVTTRGEGTLNISEEADWLTYSLENNTLTVTATENTGEAREATITITFADKTKTITVSQDKKSEDTGDVAEPVTSKITFASSGYSNAESVDGKTINIDSNISVVFAKGNASTAPSYYTSGSAIRMYQNGATLTVTAANGKTITSVKLTYASNMYYLNANTGTLSNTSTLGTWTGSASEILFTCYGTDKTQRAYVSAIEVTYE